ncbi:MAG TPA: hypothetical protein VGH90_14000, partial [Chthoniobacteraceae bacterium]
MICRSTLFLAVFAAARCFGEDAPAISDPPIPPRPPLPRTWMVSAECQMVIVPQKAMLSLVAEFRDEGKSEAAWAEVQKLVATGEATLAGELTPRGVHGQTLVSESAEEVRYPIEYESPKLPDKIPEQDAIATLKAWPAVQATPKTFQTRKAGEKVELYVSVEDDGKWLNAEVQAEHVRLLRWKDLAAGELANGDHLAVQQPEFHTMDDALNLRLKNGEKSLIGVHKVPEAGNSF